MNNIMAQFRQFMQNPQQYIQKMGVPTENMRNPEDVINYLMRSGKVTQDQYNRAAQMAGQLRNLH